MTVNVAKSTTEIVPGAVVPVGYSETTGVPPEYSWKESCEASMATLIGPTVAMAVARAVIYPRNL